MEPENKNSREDDGKVDGKRGKGLTAVTEQEVEEFFAILRRVHTAAKRFVKDNGGEGGKSFVKRKRSRSLDPEDFGGSRGVQNGGDGEEDRVGLGQSGLDLNSDPDPEGIVHGSVAI